MKKLVRIILTTILLVACFHTAAFADTLLSGHWNMDDGGNWHVCDASGARLVNCWVCEDTVTPGIGAWYLVDENGTVMDVPFVQDASGNFFSFTQDGTGIAALRFENGVYDGVSVTFTTLSSGVPGAIKDPATVAALLAKNPGAAVVTVREPAVAFLSRLDATAPRESVPRSGELYHNPKYLSSSANFIISNSRNLNTYVKLFSDTGDLVSTVFIRKGDRVKIFIPGGTYRMKQAFGEDWFGEDVMFGSAGQYWMCSVNGSYDIPLKRAGVYVISTGGSGQEISKEQLNLSSF